MNPHPERLRPHPFAPLNALFAVSSPSRADPVQESDKEPG